MVHGKESPLPSPSRHSCLVGRGRCEFSLIGGRFDRCEEVGKSIRHGGMKLKATRTVVWAADIEDRPGGLAEKLGRLAEAGANLDLILARRAPESPGIGEVFVSPLRGAKQEKAAVNAGFLKTEILHAVRVEGTNRQGFGSEITQAIGTAGINLRGVSVTAIGTRFVGYFALDGAKEAAKTIRVLSRLA